MNFIRDGCNLDDMDSFHENVTAIVNLEDVIRTVPEHLIGTDSLRDRVRELRVRYETLLRSWPIVRGRGTMRWVPYTDDWADI